MTKRQLSRHQRDVKLQRITKIAFGVLLALVVGIVSFGYWRDVIAPGGEWILRVRGVPITTQTYAKVLGWQQFQIDSQIARLSAFANQQASTAKGDDENASLIQQFVQQQVQQLQQQRASLEGTVVEQLADDELVRQEAAKRGLNVTAPDLDAEIVKQNTPPTPEPTPQGGTEQGAAAATAGSTVTGTQAQPAATPTAPAGEATPAPTPTATRTPDQIIADVRKDLGQLGLLTEAEFRDLIVKPKLLRDKLQELLGAEVAATAEQVWARHILVEQEDQAKDVLAKLQAGGDFANLAKEMSTDSGTKEKGGDLDWFAQGAMVPEFENAAFSLAVGKIVTEPVKTSYGYHIIQVLGHEQDRPLTAEQLEAAKDSALDKWLRSQRINDPKALEYGFSWERVRWARNWIANNALYLKQSQ